MTDPQAAAVAPPPRPRRAALFCWLLFTACYWTGALHKPFTTHDFYSWVYAERCTVAEILTLEDTGIGHPPLYHLAQKTVQWAVPWGHPANVRLANYVFGSLFAALLAVFLSRRPGMLLFSCGVAMSATMLDTFMICRMWGLVSLVSLLTVIVGRQLQRRFSARGLITLLALLAVGFTADYSFLLLLPFAAIACLPHGRRGVILAHLVPAAAGIILLFFRWHHTMKIGSPLDGLSLLFYDIFQACTTGSLLLFNFWFEETLLAALAVFLLCLGRDIGRGAAVRWAGLAALSFFFVSGTLVRTGLLRVRFAWVPLLACLLFAVWHRRRYPFFDHRDTGDHCLAGLACGLAPLLAVNQHFWTGLVQIRFLLVLFPLLLVYLARRLPPTALRGMALIMICSGLVYTASNGVFLYYPPATVSGPGPVVFSDVYSWANQYFHTDPEARQQPWIIDPSNFETSCRVCRMGAERVPWEQFEEVRVVGPANRDPREAVPGGFRLIDREIHLSALDDLQFALLHPIYSQRYTVSRFQRAEPAKEAP